jgi:anaerobic ribonucleoside-triphosphate reductase activating protein
VGIWLQGCSIRCAGCISMDTWAQGRGVTTVAEVLAAIAPWAGSAQGFTISGGEPFDQPAALASLLLGIRALSAADILVYSGHPLERIAEPLAQMAGLMDALISDPYDHGAPQTLALRGSDNQRLSLLTSLGRQRFAAYQHATATDRSVDVMFDADGAVWLAGIPARDDFMRLKTLLCAAGAEVTISQSTGGPVSHGAVLP